MTDILRIDQFSMEKARRKLKKKIAAALITAMAETDADYEFIGKRLEMKPAEVESWVVGLISGKSKALDQVSDLMLALGCELEFSLRRYREPIRPQADPEPKTAAAA